ncbi:MAG: hypothetical protein FJZ11_02525 [Candidatus Omnitrophica bacterium]|nr:hypothetical protein [Candidatus Omnitrophota bacterium]
MKNRGFTLTEVMVGTLIAMGLMAVIFSIFITLNTALAKSSVSINLKQQAQIAMDKMQRILQQSASQTIKIEACPNGVCSGDKITFKVPVITNDAVSGTVFSPSGVKFGGYVPTVGGNKKYSTAYYNDFFAGAVGTPEEGQLIHEVWRYVTSGGLCFLSGTPILMADGTTKPIEQIQIGDKVLAFNEKTGDMQEDKVVKLSVHNAKKYLIVNESLKVTPEHPFYSEGKWVEIGSLKIGDKLLKYPGQIQEITSIKEIEEETTVYNLEVEPSHTYFANDLLVHNKGMENVSELPSPFVRLFQEMFNSGLAYAGTTRQSLYKTVFITTKDALKINFVGEPSNLQPEIINIELIFQPNNITFKGKVVPVN